MQKVIKMNVFYIKMLVLRKIWLKICLTKQIFNYKIQKHEKPINLHKMIRSVYEI